MGLREGLRLGVTAGLDVPLGELPTEEVPVLEGVKVAELEALPLLVLEPVLVGEAERL